MRSGTLYPHKTSAPRTSARGSGSSRRIPTPTAGDARASGNRNKPGSKAHIGVSLTDYVRNRFPSPAARDYRSGKGRKPNGHTPQLPEVLGGLVNPTWCEWLMGLPAEWSDSQL